MGIQLKDILVSSRKEISFDDLSYKLIAFDAMNVIHQFVASIRQYDGTPLMDSKGNPTGHLSGLFYRTISFMESNIRPVYVFDGKAPEWKKRTQEERAERRRLAELDYTAALDSGDIEAQRKYAKMSAKVTSQMVEESKRLLKLLGVPVIDAPSEGEAQASVMCSKGLVYAVASQDYDSILFGAPLLARNLSMTGKRRSKSGIIEIKPELISLANAEAELGISREKLVWLGVLIGTDYNEGISGIGPKKALKLVKQYKTFSELVEKNNIRFVEGYDSITEIINFFINPIHVEISSEQLKQSKPDIDGIISFLCGEREFAEERVTAGLERLKKLSHGQSSLTDFFN